MKTTYYIEILKDLIRKEYSPRNITMSSCGDLSLDVFHRTSENISASTLQRFFDLVPKTASISKTSLNILSEYAGFSDWDDFCRKQESSNENLLKEKYIPDEMGLKLFEIALKNHNFSTIIDYLKLLPISDDKELNYTKQRLGSLFEEVFRRDAVARKKLLPELAKIEQGRYYFYERIVDIDYLSVYYADALSHYKKYIDYNDKALSIRDFVFASSLEILNFTNLNKKRQAIRKAYELFSFVELTEVNLDLLGSKFPLTRYYSTYLVYLKLSNQLNNDEITRIVTLIDSLVSETNEVDTNTFIIGELFRALLYCERYYDIIALYEKYKMSNIKFYRPDNYYIPLINAVEASYRHAGISFKTEELAFILYGKSINQL